MDDAPNAMQRAVCALPRGVVTQSSQMTKFDRNSASLATSMESVAANVDQLLQAASPRNSDCSSSHGGGYVKFGKAPFKGDG